MVATALENFFILGPFLNMSLCFWNAFKNRNCFTYVFIIMDNYNYLNFTFTCNARAGSTQFWSFLISAVHFLTGFLHMNILWTKAFEQRFYLCFLCLVVVKYFYIYIWIKFSNFCSLCCDRCPCAIKHETNSDHF